MHAAVAPQTEVEAHAGFPLHGTAGDVRASEQARRSGPVSPTLRIAKRIERDFDDRPCEQWRSTRQVEHPLARRAGQLEFRLQRGLECALETTALLREVRDDDSVYAVGPLGEPLLEPGDHRPPLGIRICGRVARAAAGAARMRRPFQRPSRGVRARRKAQPRPAQDSGNRPAVSVRWATAARSRRRCDARGRLRRRLRARPVRARRPSPRRRKPAGHASAASA